MNIEKITLRATATGHAMQATVFSKRAEAIEIVIGEGVHSVRCTLRPNRLGTAYAGSVMGREVVYERSRNEVAADIERDSARRGDYRRR